jgi:hypothetical protein
LPNLGIPSKALYLGELDYFSYLGYFNAKLENSHIGY